MRSRRRLEPTSAHCAQALLERRRPRLLLAAESQGILQCAAERRHLSTVPLFEHGEPGLKRLDAYALLLCGQTSNVLLVTRDGSATSLQTHALHRSHGASTSHGSVVDQIDSVPEREDSATGALGATLSPALLAC